MTCKVQFLRCRISLLSSVPSENNRGTLGKGYSIKGSFCCVSRDMFLGDKLKGKWAMIRARIHLPLKNSVPLTKTVNKR